MSDNIKTFPRQRTRRHQELAQDSALQADPYYRFVKSMLHDAAQSGLILPRSLEASTQQIYARNQHNDLISRMLQQNDEDAS